MDNIINWQEVLISAESSELAYENGIVAKEKFKEFGYTTHRYIDKDGAQAHLCSNKESVIIACRGTSEISDLLADLNIIPKRHGPGYVHNGFRHEARKIWDDVYNFSLKHKNKTFILTGHSLGAAMSTYLAQELAWHGIKNIKLYTFGSPRVGDYDYTVSIDIPHWRFVNNNDSVARLPLSSMGFWHHGKMMYIDFHGDLKELTMLQRGKDRLRGFWAALKKFELFDNFYDHSMNLYLKKIKKIVDNK